MGSCIEVGGYLDVQSSSGYYARVSRYSSHGDLIPPEEYRLDANSSAFFHWDSWDYVINSPEGVNCSLTDFQRWLGVPETDDLYKDLYDFWGYAKSMLKDFDVYALVYDDTKSDSSSYKVSAINVNTGIGSLNGRSIIGYILPNGVFEAVAKGGTFAEYTGERRLTGYFDVDYVVRYLVRLVRQFITIGYVSIRIYDATGTCVSEDLYVDLVDEDAIRKYIKDNYAIYSF